MNGMNLQELAQQRQLEEMKKKIISGVLTKEASERLSRVRVANPQLAGQVEMYLLQIMQSGRLNERITDSKLKEVLMILSEKKDFKIRRK